MNLTPTVHGLGSLAELDGLLIGLALTNVEQIRAGRAELSFSSPHIKYVREGRDAQGRRLEQWRTAAAVRQHGAGDCEDLVPWEAASWWLRGQMDVRPRVIRVSPRLMHVVLWWKNDRRITDPSAERGMPVPQGWHAHLQAMAKTFDGVAA